MTQNNILIIGGGNMGSAIAEGLYRNINNNIVIKTPRPENCKIKAENIIVTSSYDDINTACDLIILAVKPYMVETVLKDAYSFLETQNGIIVSVAAGLAYDDIRTYASSHLKVIRSMPNTPVALGAGLWGYYAPERQKIFEDIASVCGAVPYFSQEDMMHGFTALAGSGPAYIFHMIEALSVAGKNIGLPEDISNIMARQTVIGSSLLAHGKSELSAKELRENVTSPNGTTQAGLEALMGQDNLSATDMSDLTKLMTRTLLSAQKRSKEMAEK